MVPPNWDSWGKIRVLRDGFDVEAVSTGWSDDLDSVFPSIPKTMKDVRQIAEIAIAHNIKPPGSAIALYDDWVRDPSTDALHLAGRDADPTKLEVDSEDPQKFLEVQLQVLEAFRTKAIDAAKPDSKSRNTRRTEEAGFLSPRETSDVLVSDHIGPVQFNMGGIQVDADDMLKHLKVRGCQSIPPQSLC